MNGWLNIYKPKNISSAAIVSHVKKAFKGLKTGHAGTLDPLAEGILPIALGEATKLTDLLISARKTYRFRMKFGARTASGDLGSAIIDSCDSKVSKEKILVAIPKFTGEIEQTPSAFSAIKINGVRAYKLARAGVEVEVPSRKVQIYSLELLEFVEEAQEASFICQCSKGTYIRSLAEDIAFNLQNLGYVLELIRLEVGKFRAESSINFTELNERDNLKQLSNHVLPVDFVLDDILVINVEEDISMRIRNGQKINFEDYPDGLSAVYSGKKLCAIGEMIDGLFKIKRVFNL